MPRAIYEPPSTTSPPDSPRLPLRTTTLSLEEIESLTYKKALRHVKKLGFDTTHLKVLEDMQEFLKNYYHPSQGPDNNTAVLDQFKADTEELREQQNQLADICDLIEEKFTDEKNTRIGDIVEDMDAGLSKSWKMNLMKLKKVLRTHKTPILVAGETGSGKSSLINLLINKPLLPEANHPCTASICIIKNSSRPFVELRESKTDSREIGVDDYEVWRRFVSDRGGLETNDKESMFCRRVVFHTPLPQFHEGTFFVDSPGFREGPLLTEMLLKYMPKASAFVVVLMSDNNGGLNEPVKEFIISIRNKLNDISLRTMDNEISLDNVNNITVENVLFVFNRWDVVVNDQDEERTKRIRASCLATLRSLWPTVKEDENVFFLSVAKNFTQISQNLAPDANFVKLQTAVYSLIPKCHNSRINTAYMWLEQLTRRISCVARNRINMAKLSGEEKTKQQRLLVEALEKAQRAGEPIVADLRRAIDARHSKFLEDMLCHLQSEEALQRMCAFEEDEKVYQVPATEVHYLPDRDSYSKLWIALHQFFMKRIWRELLYWNEAPARSYNPDSGEIVFDPEATRFEVFVSSLRDLISKKIVEIDAEAQILRKLLEKDLEETSFRGTTRQRRSVPFGTVEKALFGITAIIWVPLAVVGSFISLPVMAGIVARQKFEGNMKLNIYRKDRASFAANLLTNFVNNLLKVEVLKEGLEEHIKVNALKTQVEKYFPAVIAEFRTHIQRLTQDERSQEEISQSFQPVLHDARQVLSHLYDFAAHNLHLFPFCEDHFSDLRAPGDVTSVIPANCRSLEEPKCAVKILKQPITKENAYRIFREEQAWRKLCKFHHHNIVAFYGLVSFGSPKRIGFVMERSDCSLQHLVETTPSVVPFQSADKSAVFARMASMALQVTRALSFIHQHNYVHRSLMMDTVSVFREGQNIILKLSDFGLSRACEDVTTTVVGTLRYLSPEVFNGRGCSGASDVYALGLLLWEMYHGERVFSHLSARELGSIDVFKELFASGKMSLTFKDEEVPCYFKALVMSCSQLQHPLRPSISQVFDQMKMIAGKDEVVL